MVSRRSMSLLVILALTAGSQAAAQVRPLGAVNQPSRVQRACCETCVDYGSAGGCGQCDVVWGTSCPDPCGSCPGLYPPCPNPCRTTLVGELLLDVRCAVCTSLTHLFSCAFGQCGVPACTSCGPCSVEMYDGCQCASSGCDCGASAVQMAPLDVGQPAPAVDEQGNPFRDDPMPQGAGAAQSMRMRSVLPAPRAAAQPRTSQRVVRRASYQEVLPNTTRATSRAVSARPLPRPATLSPSVAPQHYQPERATSLRATSGVQLQRVPQSSGSPSALRFREVE